MGNELSAQWTGDQSCFGRKQACPVRADDDPLVQNAWFPERMTVENLGGRWPSAYQSGNRDEASLHHSATSAAVDTQRGSALPIPSPVERTTSPVDSISSTSQPKELPPVKSISSTPDNLLLSAWVPERTPPPKEGFTSAKGADALSSQKTLQKPKNPVEGISCSSFSSSSVEMDKLLPIFIDWKGEQLRTASPSEQAKKGLPHDRRMTLNDITNQQGGGAGRIVHTSFTKPVYGVISKKRDTDVASVGCYQTTITLTNVTQGQWTRSRERMFCEAVAVASGSMLASVSILSVREKTGKRLLSINLEVAVRIQCESRTELERVRDKLATDDLSCMLEHHGFRMKTRKAVCKGVADLENWTSELDAAPAGAASTYRNGYSLRKHLPDAGLEFDFTDRSQIEALQKMKTCAAEEAVVSTFHRSPTSRFLF